MLGPGDQVDRDEGEFSQAWLIANTAGVLAAADAIPDAGVGAVTGSSRGRQSGICEFR